MTREEFAAILLKLLRMNRGELERLVGDRTQPSVEVTHAAMILDVMNTGKHHAMQMILDRVFGKVPIITESMSMAVPYTEIMKVAQGKSTAEIVERLKQARLKGEID